MTTEDSPESEGVGALYDRFADLFTELWDGNIHFGYWLDDSDQRSFLEAAEQMTDQMIQRLDPSSDQLVLDVGCGVGTPAIRLALTREVRVVGISISRDQVAAAGECARKAGLADRVRFEYADAMELPFTDASFDGVWALESMLHMPDRSQVLREITRVLRPGGRLVIGDIVQRSRTDDERLVRVNELQAARRFTSIIGIADYRRLVERAGLTVLETADISAHTERSMAAMAAGLLTRRDELAGAIQPEMIDQMASNAALRRNPPEIGYLLLTAVRPQIIV